MNPTPEFLEGFDKGQETSERHKDCELYRMIQEKFMEFVINHDSLILEHLENCSHSTPDEIAYFKQVLNGYLAGHVK